MPVAYFIPNSLYLLISYPYYIPSPFLSLVTTSLVSVSVSLLPFDIYSLVPLSGRKYLQMISYNGLLSNVYKQLIQQHQKNPKT